ncbi:large ribosomal subunit protein mL64 [Microcaecilia unicolor]|uniref:Large ribosomal subunit protein mL64 n=1 Tax=Microcaecilia unicolor TaxID=1415580 RepID=A0A6P7XBA3_9AMPH|nr:growth arrest and DNA damage-inducible proteins-interacting protein 1 [Microcaecilia unicolor]XP_030052853.1 growth arrest and DNA damage-inducible proteins-interacting protein 1 [Microcaecilia unicolor]
MAVSMTSLCRSWLSAVVPVAGSMSRYHARPLRRKLDGMYVPDPQDERTPEWQRGPRWEAKLFGRYGAASGVNPAQLWPDPARLREIREEEETWYPPLADMQARIRQREEEERRSRLAREKLIAANMAQMPKMIEDWRREKQEQQEKQRVEAARRERLLALAQERFGYNMDHRSIKFQELLKEMEKEEKKKEKLAKKKLRAEKLGAGPGPAQATESSLA